MSETHPQPVLPYASPSRRTSHARFALVSALPLLTGAVAAWWWRTRDWGLYLDKAGSTSRAGEFPLWWQIAASACVGMIATAGIAGAVLIGAAVVRAAFDTRRSHR